MSLKEDVFDIVSLESGLSDVGIYDRMIARHRAASRVARWFGPDSVICDVFSPTLRSVLVALRDLIHEGRVRETEVKRETNGGRLYRYSATVGGVLGRGRKWGKP
jgi:hypothetical protein